MLHVVFSCAEDLPLAVLLLFCSEGDNIPDAFTLVNHLNDWLHLLDTPVSEESEEQTAVVHLDDRAFSTFHYGEKMTSTACILRLYISNYGFFLDSHFRAKSPTNGRSRLLGVFCLAAASLRHSSDTHIFRFCYF